MGAIPFVPELENGSVTWILGYGNPPPIGTGSDSTTTASSIPALDGFTVVDAIGYYVGEVGGTSTATTSGEFDRTSCRNPHGPARAMDA